MLPRFVFVARGASVAHDVGRGGNAVRVNEHRELRDDCRLLSVAIMPPALRAAAAISTGASVSTDALPTSVARANVGTRFVSGAGPSRSSSITTSCAVSVSASAPAAAAEAEESGFSADMNQC